MIIYFCFVEYSSWLVLRQWALQNIVFCDVLLCSVVETERHNIASACYIEVGSCEELISATALHNITPEDIILHDHSHEVTSYMTLDSIYI
jgi:hypothetical protein